MVGPRWMLGFVAEGGVSRIQNFFGAGHNRTEFVGSRALSPTFRAKRGL